MKTFELTRADGSRETIKLPTWSELVFTDDIVKVELINFKRVRQASREVNNQFHSYGKFSHTLADIQDFVLNTLERHEFNTDGLASKFYGEQGAIRCFPIGKDIYLCVTWYKLGSGAYEFVGYVS